MTSIRQKGDIHIPIKKLTGVEKKIDVIIVSVNYNDFLSITLEQNIKIFNNITVVTSESDEICKKLCDKFGVKCIQTNIMYENGDNFNKGKAINLGIKSIENPEFILLLDADCIVGNNIDTCKLDKDILYTSGRIIIESNEQYERWKENETTKVRVESNRGLGFFHLFDINSRNINRNCLYPENYPNADSSDLFFRNLFNRREDINNKVIHLGSAYKNWKGRRSETFISIEKVYKVVGMNVIKPLIIEDVKKNKTFTICSYYFNFRNDVRQKNNFIKFLDQFKNYYDKMVVGVVDYGDIDFDIPCEKIVINGDKNKRIWSKEIIVNKVIERIDTDYLIWIDGDLIYENLDWLNRIDDWSGDSDFIQLFETIKYLDESGNVQESHKSIISSGRNDVDQLLRKGYKPGGAWMGKTSILKEKKLFEKMYVGGGDTIFVYGLFNITNGWIIKKVEESNSSISRDAIDWISKIKKYKISYLQEPINHLYHGPMESRNYNERYKSLEKIDEEIDKYLDIKYFDFCIIITTYNRSNLLKRLLEEIYRQKCSLRIKVLIFDDGSTFDYTEVLNKFEANYIKYIENHGKINYWSIISDTFKYCKNINSKYFIYLPDDVGLKESFFENCVKFYENIDDKNKICLSILTDEHRRGKPNWTGFIPIEYNDHYKTQWCDLCFICEKDFFEILEYKVNEIPKSRWNVNKELGSGVGQQLSMRLLNKNKNMYHLKETLVIHDDHDSVMNFENRKKIKLISK